jgi:hypothetical protein
MGFTPGIGAWIVVVRAEFDLGAGIRSVLTGEILPRNDELAAIFAETDGSLVPGRPVEIRWSGTR